MERTVLNLLPHPGGGAETFIDCLAPLPGFRQERRTLSPSRSALAAGPAIVARWPGLVAEVRGADIVQVHGDVAATLSLPVLRRRPSVAVMQGLHFLRRARGARLRLARMGLRQVAAAARIVCSSRSEIADLVAAGVARDRIELVANTIPPRPAPRPEQRSAARSALGLADEVTVLYVGQLEPRKDPLVAVEAAEEVRRRGLPVVLLLAGGGPLLGELRRRASDAVRVLGPRDDVDGLLAAADVFVMPSRREGLSFALLEAMHAGLPAVVSDGAGNPEAVGEAGVVVPAGEADAFAEALAQLAANRDERRRIGQAARRRFAAEFSQERFVERMSALYRSVLAAAGR